MQIFIRTPEGKKFGLDVSPNDTINKIKCQIKERKGIPVDEQKLFFEGKELNINNKSLKSYQIEDYYKLTLEIHNENSDNKQQLNASKNSDNKQQLNTSKNSNNNNYYKSKDISICGVMIIILIGIGILVLTAISLALGYTQCPSGSSKNDNNQNTNDNPNNCLDNKCIDNNTFECISWTQNKFWLIVGYISLFVFILYAIGLIIYYCNCMGSGLSLYSIMSEINLIKCMSEIKLIKCKCPKSIGWTLIFLFSGAAFTFIILSFTRCPQGAYMQDDEKRKYNPNHCITCIDENDYKCKEMIFNSLYFGIGITFTVIDIIICIVLFVRKRGARYR